MMRDPKTSDCPVAIERLPQQQKLRIVWPDGLVGELPLVPLRAECPCARCVDEITGERIVDVEGIDPHIAIRRLELAGGYALRIVWSDGHDSGLFTWPHLRRLCAQTAGLAGPTAPKDHAGPPPPT
jgi:DUF971 family protein